MQSYIGEIPKTGSRHPGSNGDVHELFPEEVRIPGTDFNKGDRIYKLR